MVLLSPPAIWKTEGVGRECAKGRVNLGRATGVRVSGGCSHPGHACRDSSRECCPSNPDLISFILRTINPSSLPVVLYHTAEGSGLSH